MTASAATYNGEGMALASGTRLGPYEILAPLGAGGMGEVYKARDNRLGRDVAAKILPAAVANNAERRARFEKEAKAASALNHPGIVAVYDIGEENGMAYLITEFVDGSTLRHARPESLRKQLDLAAQIAEALAAAHTGGITHRDLKPENIMVADRDGRAKILDFGLARVAPGENEATVTAGPETMPGTIMGTAGYMSPEQARAKPADHRSDIFSLGAVLYELFSGRRAFEGDSFADTLTAILTKDPPELPATVPAGVRQIIERCLEKDAPRRFQSAQDLAFALRALSGTNLVSREEVQAALPEPAPEPRRARWPFAVAAAFAVLFALGFWRLATEPAQIDTSLYRFRPFAIEDYPETSPVWSPDGTSIVYNARPKTDYELMVKSIDGSPPTTLARSSQAFSHMSWTPDGSRVYYTDGAVGRVYSVGRAGGDPVRLSEEIAYAARLSPDGRTLAALMYEQVNGQAARVLILKSPPESQGKKFDVFPGALTANRLVWSPDGTKILMSIQGQPPEIRSFDVASGTSRRVSEKPISMVLSPAWLPNTRHALVAWPEDIGGRSDLWLLDTESGERTLALASPVGNAVPAVSSKGTVAYMTDLSDIDLIEFPVDGSPARPLLATRQSETAVSWSPVAPEFAYVSQKQIRLRRADGSLDRTIVTAEEFPPQTDFYSPVISPDGTRIAYVAFTGQASFNAWISPLSGGSPVTLGDINGYPYGMSWSPDGRWIVFNSSTGLQKIAVGSSGKSQSMKVASCGFTPTWSPDGSRVLCHVSGNLAVIPVDGGETVRLGSEYDQLAAWSKDMAYIYAIRRSDGKRELGRLDWQNKRFQPIVSFPARMGVRQPRQPHSAAKPVSRRQEPGDDAAAAGRRYLASGRARAAAEFVAAAVQQIGWTCSVTPKPTNDSWAAGAVSWRPG